MYKKIAIQLGIRAALFMFGFHWVRCIGRRATSKEAPIVSIAPHSSLFDTLAMHVGIGICSGVTKEDNVLVPIIGRMLPPLSLTHRLA